MDTRMTNDHPSAQSHRQPEALGQVLCFVSAKGGTGKTILSACTAYALLEAGVRVLTIDTDFSTRGLSLFLLGGLLESQELHIKSTHCLADSILDEVDIQDVTPLNIVRGSLEYNVMISNKDVWRGGVPDERFLGGSPHETAEKRVTPLQYFNYLNRLCERFRKEYDYIIIDTRGGYDFTSAAPATIADGYVIVLEADRVSVEQVSGFKKKMDDYASSLDEVYPQKRQSFLKGFIVNKALFSVDDLVFPDALAREYDSKTFGVIPVDKEVIRAYQKKNVPYEKFPDSDFSYYSLGAIEHLISPSVNWPWREKAKKFYKFLSSIRSQWEARRRTTFFLQALIPSILILLAILCSIFYLFFKSNSAGYSLQAFYIASTIFVLLSTLGAMLSTLSLMREREWLTTTRKMLGVGFLILLTGLAYLVAFDVPRTFSQGPLLQRVQERDKLIDKQDEQIDMLTRQVSDLSTENQFLRADKEQAANSIEENQNQINELQNQIATLKVQVSSIKRDRDSAQSALSNSEQQATSLRQSLNDCQRKIR
jgi:MinD-like ATPase involved in chromosome partitioning or flagellar assembly